MSRVLPLLVILSATACGDDTSAGSGGGGGANGGDATTAGSTGAGSPPPPIAESCETLCDKARAAACAADGPLDTCEDECIVAQTHESCPDESGTLAACAAAGDVICSVDDESTPIAPCGDETRALSGCLAASP